MVASVFDMFSSIPSPTHQQKQLLDILRLRDNEVIKANERVAEVTGLLAAADKTLEAMRQQVKQIEKEKEEVSRFSFFSIDLFRCTFS